MSLDLPWSCGRREQNQFNMLQNAQQNYQHHTEPFCLLCIEDLFLPWIHAVERMPLFLRTVWIPCKWASASRGGHFLDKWSKGCLGWIYATL